MLPERLNALFIDLKGLSLLASQVMIEHQLAVGALAEGFYLYDPVAMLGGTFVELQLGIAFGQMGEGFQIAFLPALPRTFGPLLITVFSQELPPIKPDG